MLTFARAAAVTSSRMSPTIVLASRLITPDGLSVSFQMSKSMPSLMNTIALRRSARSPSQAASVFSERSVDRAL